MCLDGAWEKEQCAGVFKKASGYTVVSGTGAALWVDSYDFQLLIRKRKSVSP